jgi:WD40 repeat protein
VSEAEPPEASGLVPAGERSLVGSPGGLAARGLALAAELSAQPLTAGPPGELRCFRGHSDCVVSVALSPDGQFALTGGWDRTVRVWELPSGREVRRIDGHGDRVSSVACSPGGRELISGSWDGTARVWDRETGEETARFGESGAGMVHCVAFSPDGRHVAWGSSLPDFALCDAAAGRELRRCDTPVGAVRSLKFSPDGRRILSGSGRLDLAGEGRESGALCLWDAQNGERLWGWAGAVDPVLAVAFSTDGSLALSSTGRPARSRLNVTQVWEVGSGREVGRYEAHRQPVFSGVFLPNARFLLLGGRDRLLRLWDTEEQREVHRLHGHTDAVFSVAVAADGRFALSGSGDGTARLWRLPDAPGSGE